MCHGLRDVANVAWKMAAIVREGADVAILATYQAERDPHVRAVIGAAVEAGRYICELDPAKAAARDADIRRQSQARSGETAADLIPAIREGIVLAGTPAAGERFIQPLLGDGGKLDDLTGGGWRLFVRDGTIAGDARWVTRVESGDLSDAGAVLRWLDARQVDAVLVRPDHYVFGTASGSAAPLLQARARQLGLALEAAR
jgi:3-(3-hydroxy-phenyl)propionate hydroxylase